MYLNERSLWEDSWDTFEWIEHENNMENMLIFLRKTKDFKEHMIAIFNFSGGDRVGYKVGVPEYKKYKVLLNSDDTRFGGTGYSKKKVYVPIKESWNYREQHLVIDIKANSAIFLKADAEITKPVRNTKKSIIKKEENNE